MSHGSSRIASVIAIMLILGACERSSFPEYKNIAEDTYLRLYMLGEGDRLAADGDSVLMRLRISEAGSEHGSLYSTQQWYAVEDLRRSAFQQLLIRMHEGDSMSLIATAEMLPWDALLQDEETEIPGRHIMVRTEVSMLALRTAAMMKADEERLRSEDPQAYEKQLTLAFLDQAGPGWQQWGSSDVLYIIQGFAMDTNQVQAGDMVTISYIGRRVEDRSIFDSTEDNGGPMTFRIGDKGQVVNGLEVAIHLLREGQEGEFFLPSEYAFGPRGVEGKIDPFTPVIYSVRLEDVQRRQARSRRR